MAASFAKFYFDFLIVSIILWMIFIFCSKLFSWMLGASVKFRVSGLKCLRDVVVKFEKGAIESVSVGEIKLSLRQFLIKLKDPKMQVLICDLEVVMRSSTSTTNIQNYESQKSRSSGGRKWIVVANVARFLSVSVTNMVVKTPKVIVEVKELNLDISKDGGTKPNLYVKLNVLQILVHLCESRISLDQSSNLGFERCSSSASLDRSSAALFCDELSLSSEFGHDREVGTIIRSVEVISGDVILNFDEDSFPESKQSLASIQDEVGTPNTTTTSSAKKPHKEHQLLAALTKYSPSFPEKISFSLRKLDVIYRENGLVAENNITGVILNVKSKSFEDTGESKRLDIAMELSEIHLLRKDESSVVKITKVDMVSFINIPIQPDLPIRTEVDMKVGGTRCDLFMSRLQPWLQLHGETHTLEKSEAADLETIMWSGTVSIPYMTVTLYGLDDLPMYHFCSQPSLVSANNISNMGKTIHFEVGTFNLELADEPHTTTSILCYASEECKRLKYSVSLEISQFSFCLNKASHSIQLELVRAKSIYQEFMEEHKPCSKLTLFDMHNVKFVRRSTCSFFTATEISLSWEPDVHLSFYELFLRLRSLLYAQNLKEDESGCNKDISSEKDVDEQKKMESIFAIDVDMLAISAKVEDEVEIKLEVKSFFSEKVSIGVILEEIILTFNGSQVFKSTRMQISRILGIKGGLWDWVVQGTDVHICLPYKLQLRGIADSIEEMLRGLRLITVEEEENIFPGKVESSKPKEFSPKFGCIRFCMSRVTAYIEEEPMQGWLDEHYQLMKKEACEVAVRLKFLHKETSDSVTIKEAMEEIHKQSFQSYYKACEGLVPSEGSGACREGFQAGFKPSASRTSLFSVCATDFDLSLTAVHENDAGLMDVLKKLDPICQENDVNFSRLNGNNVCLKTGSLAVMLRDYTLPLLSCTSGKCEGRIVQLRAQQGDEEKCKSSGQPQISQDVFVGRWRKVKMFQSTSDTTQPMKTYLDLRIHFEKGEVSFGVGYEPAFADISYAISVALGTITQVIEEEESLPWWDNMRNNFRGSISLSFSESKWDVLATTDPYESRDKLQIVTGGIEFQQSNGRVFVNAEDFKIKLSSLESMISRHSLEVPHGTSGAAFFEAPVFTLEVQMDWYCDSENVLNVFDPCRSTSLSLQCNFSFIPENESIASASPTMNLGAQDLAWILKFCGMNSDPPNKLRSFSRWPRFGVPRVAIPESLSLDQVMTELMLRIDVTPYLIKYMPWDSDDPAKGLTLSMKKLKYELCFSRGKQKYTFECNRDALDLVYQSLDLRVVKAFINKDEHHRDEGFLLSSDYLTIKRQAPKADHERLLAWQEAGRRNLGNGSESDEHIGSDSSDDDDDNGYNVVIADNCQRIFVSGFKLLWTIQNRDVVRSFAGGISKAFEPPKPSPSRQYTQMKILEENQKESCPETHQDRVCKVETSESEEEGTQHFMVNVIKPQFNLHSEEANGRFLLAANSGRVLARSFHSIMRVGEEVIEHALGTGSFHIPECSPEMTWKRREFSIMLEHVQAHVAPTDADPGAGLQWLPKIHRNHQNVKRTGALLESVFMPCDMYLRYTRHKAGTPDLKVKPLKEITFNSHNITATMTSRQFQIMMDVLANLLFARLPKPRKSSLQCPTEDEDVEEEADEVVPYGVEEVELAKINLEEKERERKLLLDDIRKLSHCFDNMDDTHMERESESELWMIRSRRSILVQGLKNELLYAQKSKKEASASLRMELQKAAQLRLLEEKNKSPSYAMSISLQINKVVWSMFEAGKSFAEAEIHNMIYDFDRDYKDIGVARFTTKYFVVRNCLPNAKSDMFLSAWNPPPEWGKKLMLRVDSKQGAPKDGNYPFELFQVEIYPLRIHLTEKLYTMMWDYFFPGEEQDFQRPQKSNTLNLRSSTSGSAQELRITSSLDKTWEETMAESVANELVLQAHSCTIEQHGDSSKQKLKEKKQVKSRLPSRGEKKTGQSRPRKIMEFHNIKISQVELLITYEGSRFVVNDLKLLMDTFHRVEFTGTWQRLFSRVKKHIIWGVVKSVTGIQGKKFKDKSYNSREFTDNDLNLSDNDQNGEPDQEQVTWFKRQSDRAGDGFVTSIRRLFNTQRRKNRKAFVLRTMRGEAENDSDSDEEASQFARQLTIAKAKRLIRRHTKKFRPRSQRVSTSQKGKSLPEETTAFEESGYSSGSSAYEDFAE